MRPAMLDVPDAAGHTLFHSAAWGGKISVMQWVESKRPSMIDLRTDAGQTVFHSAAWGGTVPALKWLFRKRPKMLLERDKSGWTAFHSAAKGFLCTKNESVHERRWRLFRLLQSGKSAVINGTHHPTCPRQHNTGWLNEWTHDSRTGEI